MVSGVGGVLRVDFADCCGLWGVACGDGVCCV